MFKLYMKWYNVTHWNSKRISAVDQLSPAADACPQASSWLGNAGQVEAPQRLSDTGQDSWFCGLPQVLVGNVVYSPQLFTIVVPEVTELLCSCVRDDGYLGRRAGYAGVGGWTGNTCCSYSCCMSLPSYSPIGGRFAFGTRFNWMWWCFLNITSSYIIYSVNFNLHLNHMLECDTLLLSLSISVCSLHLFFCLVSSSGQVPLFCKDFLCRLWGTAVLHVNGVRDDLLFIDFNSWGVL